MIAESGAVKLMDGAGSGGDKRAGIGGWLIKADQCRVAILRVLRAKPVRADKHIDAAGKAVLFA